MRICRLGKQLPSVWFFAESLLHASSTLWFPHSTFIARNCNDFGEDFRANLLRADRKAPVCLDAVWVVVNRVCFLPFAFMCRTQMQKVLAGKPLPTRENGSPLMYHPLE